MTTMSNLRLDDLTRRHTSARRFAELVASASDSNTTYRPTIRTVGGNATQNAERTELADAFDRTMEERGLSKRAHRGARAA